MLNRAEIYWGVLVRERWTAGYRGTRSYLDLADFSTDSRLAIFVEH